MKPTIKITVLVLLAVATLAGCSKHDDDKILDTGRGEIRLSTAAQAHQTRADMFNPDVQIAASQHVGLHITKADGTTPLYTNYNYTADGIGGLALQGSLPTPYYPADGGNVKISAYHPHWGNSSAYDFVVADNQNTDAVYYGSDLLFSAPKEYRRQTAAHLLTFEHVLSKATYTLVAGTGSPNLTGATVELLDLERAVNFAPTTGAVTTATTSIKGNITPHATYGAIVAPQTVVAGKNLIKVTLANGAELYHKAPVGGQTFAQGVKYHFTITVKYDELKMTVQTVPWEPVGNVNGDAELGEGLPLDQAQVGDFYCMDEFGEYILPKDATLSDAQKAACVGVVFKAGKDADGDWKDDCDYKQKDGVTPMPTINGYVLGLYHSFDTELVRSRSFWSTISPNANVTFTPENAYTFFNGYTLTGNIIYYAQSNKLELKESFPALYWSTVAYEINKGKAPEKSSGWFMPSAGQCLYWCQNKDIILASLKKATSNDALKWEGGYWSSTEVTLSRAVFVHFEDDIMYSAPKDNRIYIRPVLAF